MGRFQEFQVQEIQLRGDGGINACALYVEKVDVTIRQTTYELLTIVLNEFYVEKVDIMSSNWVFN